MSRKKTTKSGSIQPSNPQANSQAFIDPEIENVQIKKISRKKPGELSAKVVDKTPVTPVKPAEPVKQAKPFKPDIPNKPVLPVGFGIDIVRPRDLLVLRFSFLNLKRSTDAQTGRVTLVPINPTDNAYISVTFPPQSIEEEALFERAPEYIPPLPGEPAQEVDESPNDLTPAMQSKLSGTSRLVFRLPKNPEPIEFTIEGLLSAIKRLPLVVAATAKPAQKDETISGWQLSPGILEKAKARWIIDKVSVPVDPAKSKKVTAQYAKNRFAIARAQARCREQKVGLIAEIGKFNDWIISEQISGLPEFLKPELKEPTNLETAIEAPFRLILSPNRHAAWVHAVDEVKSVRGQFDSKQIGNVQIKAKKTDWVELWHTRLATRDSDSNVSEDPTNPMKTVRAIWAKDAGFYSHYNKTGPAPQAYPNDPYDNPYRSSLDSADRYNFVHLSANYRLFKNQDRRESYIPRAIPTRQMMLTSLGSWLNLRGAWDPAYGLSVEEWRHISTMARDHYVRVVYRGFLFPFGHRASLVKITERKFHNNLKGNPAYLRQRMFIVVREPEKTYIPMDLTDPYNQQYDLAFPFTRIRITTLVTPFLAKPANSGIGGKSRELFRPVEGSTGQEIRFHVIATDLDGREVEFSTPMNFVGKEIVENPENPDEVFDLMKMTQWDFTGNKPDGIAGLYPSLRNAAAKPAKLAGQEVCYADSQIQGDTVFNTEEIMFGAQTPDKDKLRQLREIYSPDFPPFYPRIEWASAKIPAIKHLARNEGIAKFVYPEDYLVHGFNEEHNKGQVFAQLCENTLELDFSTQGQRSGGLLTPNMQINGISRLHGPVGGTIENFGSMTSNTFKPEEFFAGMPEGKMPKLFGVLNLWEIINPGGGPPQFISQTLSPLQSLSENIFTLKYQLETFGVAADQLKDALSAVGDLTTDLIENPASESFWTDFEAALNDLRDNKIPPVLSDLNKPGVSASVRIPIETALMSLSGTLADINALIGVLKVGMQALTEQKVTLDWDTDLISWPESDPIFEAHEDNNGNVIGKLYLHAELDAKSTKEGGASFLMSCGVKEFSLNLIGTETLASFVKLKFDKIEFVFGSSQKADVNVEFDEIEFVGVLSFVEALKFLIPLDGFSDPPGLEISEEGIVASLSLGLPNLTFGVFSLTNMSLGAGFSVPFIGDPLSVWFSFCTRDNPFCLTVAMFGGGGFFSITLQPDGLKCLEASFEFGASLTLDVGVASGGIYAMAGIYFKMEMDNATLTGYFRMGGFLSVMGIVSISIELYLELTYESATGKCAGRATLTIEVEVLFFSVGVEITAERKFAGSNGDPTFAELMAPYKDPFDEHEVYPWPVYCEAFA